MPVAIPRQESSDELESHSTVRVQDRNRKVDKKQKHRREPHPTFDEVLGETLKKVFMSTIDWYHYLQAVVERGTGGHYSYLYSFKRCWITEQLWDQVDVFVFFGSEILIGL